MLKRLELVGFKSFADRTFFDFADGLTGIIGPNGSGKSNVVDAIKWALGEQSAKSLRGGDMTDVIFNGSASRRSLGMAEVALVFDNAKKQFAAEAEEVRIVRRVYRSGEAEYLLNGEVCRLKDIKDVLLGSGAGTDAYSIIEQGRVDQLLQTAPKERRIIFEEAAGISRFRARKTQALRKMELVGGNMERLRDILDEVEKQLRTARLQASRAQLHQQYTARLRELRVGLSLSEYHGLAVRLADEAAELAQLRAGLEQETAAADCGERELMVTESKLGELEPALGELEAALAGARQQIAADSARRDSDEASLARTEEELSRSRSRLAVLALEARGLDASCLDAGREVSATERQRAEMADTAHRLEVEQSNTEVRTEELARQAEALKSEHLEQMRQGAKRANDAVGHKAELDNFVREHARLQARSDQASEHLASLDLELKEWTLAVETVLAKRTAAQEKLAALRARREELGRTRDELTQQAADLKARRSGVASRIEVLENLERSHEGLGTGVREVLTHLQDASPGPWQTVVGLVAEVLTVRREYAPLIDLALGERAQRFLVRDMGELAEALRQRGQPLSGRVSFLQLTSPAAPDMLGHEALNGPAVVALAEDVVRCDAAFVGLPNLLLGQTLIVRELSSARALASQLPDWRFITLEGELLEPDGTVTVGTHHAETGILSRRSELRDLREEVTKLNAQAGSLEWRINEVREQAAQLGDQIGHAESEIAVLNEQAGDMRERIAQHIQKRDGLSADITLSQSEMSSLGQEITRLREQWEAARQMQFDAEANVQSAKARLEEAEREIRALAAGRDQQQQQALAARVALAQVEERLAGLRARQEQLDQARRAKQSEAESVAARLADQQRRLIAVEVALLRYSASLADAYHRKEASERCLIEGQALRAQLRGRRQALADQVQTSRTTWRQRQEAAHKRELSVNTLEQNRQAVCRALRDDYQIELEALYRERTEAGETAFELAPSVNDDGKEADPATEILDLKARLRKLGSVNLDSLVELEELEARHSGLRLQYDDLEAARSSLVATIERINTDCRRMFTETFDAIKAHFQELFRKLFAGGEANIELEEGVDILDSGIEVRARPPGKELRSISLMSGGEKTMTAVALLLAIFRSKPSPFCILDEVDAALDEANVGRFAGTLREFVGQSQFILITHHKRTMASADVLYGVTMAESGVSSRYSVRFEDWDEDEAKQAA
jgi:chromosome segregation protein